MFIVSKRSFEVPLPDGSFIRIPRDYIGEIPDAAAQHPLIQGAIKSGWVSTPITTKDAALYAADAVAEEAEAAADIRPDAVAEEAEAPAEDLAEAPAEARKKKATRKK